MTARSDTEPDEPIWILAPFTHIRCVGTYEEYSGSDTGYRAFLIFVHDGRAAVTRLPLILGGPRSKTWDRLDAEIRHVLDLLAELEHDVRLEFHRVIDETMDLPFTLEGMRAKGPNS